MSTLGRISSLAGAGALLLGLTATQAFAGHTNILLNADLDGREEVSASAKKGKAGDKNGRGEIYVFGIDGNPNVICYNLQVKRIAELELAPGNGRAAHIHKGERGDNGPVVANLAWPQGGQSADCLNGDTQPERFPNSAGVPALIADILANPESYYVNVHNSEFPAGAIRGQLEVAEF